MIESEFQGQVVDLLRTFGWRLAHFRPAKTERGWRTPMQGDVGFPDLVAVRPPRLIFAELKGERGRLRPEQEEWIAALSACAAGQPSVPVPEVYIWRPSDFDEIVRVLRR